MTDLKVTSEIGTLEKVLIHSPDEEWNLVPCGPGWLEEFLVEDIFVLKIAQQEHKIMKDILGYFLGDENVLEFTDLLTVILGEELAKHEVVSAVAALEMLGEKTIEMLENQPANLLAKALIRGALIDPADANTYQNLFNPSPNLMFVRDLGAMIPKGFILGNAAKSARKKETLLMRYVFRHHPLFDKNKIPAIDCRNRANEIFWNREEGATVEGGDILVLNDKILMIGCGERTTEIGIDLLMHELFCKGSISWVVRANLPHERASMHLDTVFTIVDEQYCLVYKAVLESISFSIFVAGPKLLPRMHREKMNFEEILKCLKDEGLKLMPIYCGGRNPLFSSREQWTDGANLFAIAPGLLLGYERNLETIKELEKIGYQHLRGNNKDDEQKIRELAESFKSTRRVPANGKMIISIPGSELSRARGGPRCMTLPLSRSPI